MLGGGALEEWAVAELSNLLGAYDMAKEIALPLLELKDPKARAEMAEGLLGAEVASSFLAMLREREKLKNLVPDGEKLEPNTFYMKDRNPEGSHAGKKKGNKGAALSATAYAPPPSNSSLSSNTGSSISQSSPDKGVGGGVEAGKKKQTYRPIDAFAPVLLPGQHVCDCLATKHKLVGNCLECGRIVCEQEGLGPCTFCGLFIIGGSADVQAAHRRKVREAAGRKAESAKDVTRDEDTARAVEAKNRLVEFERNRAKRTIVLDDQADYFRSDSNWISPQEREKVREAEKAATEAKWERKGLRITFDFTGRRIVEAATDEAKFKLTEEDMSEIDGAMEARLARVSLPPPPPLPTGRSRTVRADYVATGELAKLAVVDQAPRRAGRVQHEDGYTITAGLDTGSCLSMHQPWASLLVAGVKRVEGREWGTSFRGRLWIASTSQAVNQSDVDHWEQHYQEQWEKRGLERPALPLYYPTQSLLGYVDVLDVVPLEEYDASLEDSDSAFCFICANPTPLLVPLKISGQHKIWKLDPEVHRNARSQLES